MGKSHSNASSAGSSQGLDQQQLKLHSPVGSEPMVWPFPGDQQRHYHSSRGGGPSEGGVGAEIADTIKWVCDDFPTLKQALDVNDVLKSYDVKSYESMKTLCTKYNQSIDAILQLEKGTSTLLHRLQQRPSRGLLKHIIQKVYNTAVTDPEKLNNYEPFSPEVYGETSYDLVCKIIDQVDLNEDDVFIDLGSGVGQVVLQIAGLTKCKTCLGIEKADVPSSYALAMDSNFRKWMKWFGKKFSEYKLIKGDFLDTTNRDKITGSTIVFVNNYAFGPVVDHELKERFQDLKDGARVVSSRAFCPLQFRITERTLGDIGAIIHIQELESTNGNVSWTNKPVSYYCHTIDRSKLQRYFESIKKKRKQDTSSNEGADENTGPTTRRAWSDWCSKSNKTSEEEEEEEPTKRRKRGKTLTKARNRLRRAKGKKRKPINQSLKFSLDLLHQSTLNSTTNADHAPARGTIDQKLTQLTTIATTGLFTHEELPPSSDTPYALQKLLELYRKQMLGIIEGMKTEEFRQQVEDQIEMEKEKRVYLLSRAEALNNSINKLIQDSTELLKLKLEELNIKSEGATADTLLSEARSIVIKHKEIQSRAESLQTEVDELERENGKLVEFHKKEILKRAGLDAKMDESKANEFCHNYLLKELVHTLEERKRLQREASRFGSEVERLEESVKEQEKKKKRMRSQREWPEIPSLEIINEKNPELLAKRILETGRLVEGQQQSKRGPPANSGKVPAGPPSGPYPTAAPPRVNYLEDRLEMLITNCLKEDSGGEKRIPRTPPPPPIISDNRKQVQISPDIASGPPTNTKNALRAHLSKAAEKAEPPRAGQHHQPPQSQQQQPSPGSKRTIGDIVNTEVDRCLKQGRASVLVAGPGMEGLGAVLQMQYGQGQPQQQQQQKEMQQQRTGPGGGFVTEVVLGEKEPNVNSVLRVVRKRVEEQQEQPPAKRSLSSPSPAASMQMQSTTAITRIPTPGSRVHTPTTPPATDTKSKEQPRPTSQPPPADSPHQWQSKIQHNFEKLFSHAAEARRKSTEAKLQREKEAASGVKTSGNGESPDSGLGKELPIHECSKRSAMALPRTPSPSHVDEEDELVFGAGYKEWIDDEEPPPTPRLVKQESCESGTGLEEEKQEEVKKEVKEEVASEVQQNQKQAPVAAEPIPPAATAAPAAPERERPPSTASSTCSDAGPHRPSSTASSSAASEALHNSNTPQHFKKRWNQSQQMEATITSTTSEGAGAAPLTSTTEDPQLNKFRPKGKLYIQQQQQIEVVGTPPPVAPQQSQQQHGSGVDYQTPAHNVEQRHQQMHSYNPQQQHPSKPQLKNIVLNGGQPVYNKVNGSVTTAAAGGGSAMQQAVQFGNGVHGGSGMAQQQQQQHYGQPHNYTHAQAACTPPSQQQQPPLPPLPGPQQHYQPPPPPPPPPGQGAPGHYSHGGGNGQQHYYNQQPTAARFQQQYSNTPMGQQQQYHQPPPPGAGGMSQHYGSHGAGGYMQQQQKMQPHPGGYHQPAPIPPRYTNFGQQQQRYGHYGRYGRGGPQQPPYGGGGGYYGGGPGQQRR